MDCFCNQNADQLGSLAGLSFPAVSRKLEGEVNVQHPARIWVERQENKSVMNEPERLPTTSECGHHLLQIVKGLKQGTGCICRCSRMRAHLSPPRVLLPNTYTQDGLFLQPKRRPAWLPRRTIFSRCICRCSRMRARLPLHILLLHFQVSRGVQ
jgi:hypothetical protein